LLGYPTLSPSLYFPLRCIFGFSEKSLDAGPKSVLFVARPTPTEGRIAIVVYAGWDAVDAAASSREEIAGRVFP
jgi:hypothetical protein